MGGVWTLILVEPGGTTRDELSRCVHDWDLAIDAWPLQVGQAKAWALQLLTIGTARARETPLTPVPLPTTLSSGLVLHLAAAAGASRTLSKRVGVFMLSDGAGIAEVVTFTSGHVEAAEQVCDGELTTEQGTSPTDEDSHDFLAQRLDDFLGTRDLDDVSEALWDARSGEGELGIEEASALSTGSGSSYRTLKCRTCGASMLPADSFVTESGRVCAACFRT